MSNNNNNNNGSDNTNSENDEENRLMLSDNTNGNEPAQLLPVDATTTMTTPALKDTNVPRICCALLASIVTGGVTYAFGLYGAALKRNLHLTQTQLDTISTATFIAGLLSWVPGMFVDRFGTRVGITLGGITGFTSLMLYWAVAKQIIEFSEKAVIVTILSGLGVTTFLSCALITGSVFKIISCSCGPGTKGSAVGVAKGYVGLGSGAFACLFESIRSPTSSDLDFLPMGAFLFLVCCTIPSFCFMEQRPVPDVMTPLHFRVLYASLLCLAAVVVGTSLLSLYDEKSAAFDSETKASSAGPNYPMAGLIVAVWIGPLVTQLFLPQKTASSNDVSYAAISLAEDEEQDGLLTNIQDENTNCNNNNSNNNNNNDTNTDNNLALNNSDNKEFCPSSQSSSISNSSGNGSQEQEEMLMDEPDNDRPIAEEEEQPDRNLFQMLQTPGAWILLWIATLVVGGGTVETNNMGQMVESLKFPSVVTSASLALFSVAQSGGRVLTGVVSENALNWNTQQCCIDKGVPRPFFLIVTSLVGVIAHTLLAATTDQTSFVIGTALSGLSFGGVWPMLVLIVGEIFGTAHVGANYMFYDGVCSAGGTFLLSKVVAQKVYESHIDHHYSEHEDDNSDGVTCYGQACFQATHVIISLLLLTCVAMSCVFMYTTRHIYQKPNLHVH